MKNITVLGSTGSIGVNTLDVIERHTDRFHAFALTANTSVEALLAQCVRHRPRYAVVRDEQCYAALRDGLRQAGLDTEPMAGMAALAEVAGHGDADMVMAAIVGGAGLLPVLEAARTGKRILLANKEALVMSGPLLLAAAKQGAAQLIPIDSEHNAIFQCLPADQNTSAVRRILLTASGGPFLDLRREELGDISVAQACAHPNWRMGRKISVDSATMINKALEWMEACLLFGVEPECVQVVIHPQSIVHSMVEYVDGSLLAQLGQPDMRTPIANGLGWPERVESGVEPLQLADIAALEFRKPDEQRFPGLALARKVLAEGANRSIVFNAANETAVAAFLEGRLPFNAIERMIAEVLEGVPVRSALDLDEVLAEDAAARAWSARWLERELRV